MTMVIFKMASGSCVATSSECGNDVCGNNTHKEAMNPVFDENESTLLPHTATQNPPRRLPSNAYCVTSLPLDAYSVAAKNRMDNQDMTQTNVDASVLEKKTHWWKCCFARWFNVV